MDKKLIEAYASFVVRKGANIQKGQTLAIDSPIECAPFARLCASAAYAAGARDVVIFYNDEKFSRIRMDKASVEALEDVKPWLLRSRMDYYEAEGGVCRIAIAADDPELYLGLDSDKVDKAAQARSMAMKPWMELVMANRMQWCVVSVPTEAWAKKVFPGSSGEDAVEKLWQAILDTSRVSGGDPDAAWQAHASASRSRLKQLNTMGLDTLHLVGENGTDLIVGLDEGYIFHGIESETTGGLPFLANIPSEELFTAPHHSRVDGIVKSSLPYVYNGNLIEGITARFENGVAVDVHAEKGDDLMQQMMSADDGARRLGEIALVPASSPIRKTGLLFYNTLFDENAACHMAFGAAYPTCIKGGTDMNREQQDAHGLNDSLIHEDVMIGTPEMDITGKLRDGGEVALFRKGEWVI